jgi:hypothetical protein
MKKYFGAFFHENKYMLVIASIGLSVPLIVRGILDLLRIDETFEDKITSKEGLYDSLFFVLGDMIPLSLQLSSLIFGYIRG